MREIKFRAWSLESKSFIQGQYLMSSLNKEIITVASVGEDEMVDENCVLQQYTGLKDKNGKEIYEGDILRIKDGDQIGWQGEGDPILKDIVAPVKWEGGIFWCGIIGIVEPQEFEIEIIGNIYEHHELLTPTPPIN